MHQKNVFLYVDDDLNSRLIMDVILKRQLQLLNVVIWEDSKQFRERVEALHPQPNVFLLDIHVQPYDGFTMLKMLREHPQYANCFVVALTASVMAEEIETLRHAGFNGVIAKPITQRLFATQLERVLQGEVIWGIK